MKKIFLSMLMLSIIPFIACNKKDATISKAGMLTSGSWSLTAATHDNDGNGSYETDDFSGFSACYTDNVWIFRDNGELQFNEGPTKCDPIDPDSDITNWKLSNNETILVLDGDEYSITELSNSTLKIKQALSGNRSSMVTFTKR